MNILISNDDGHEAKGLKILQESARRRWPEATRITITPSKPMTGQGMSITAQAVEDMQREEVEPGTWVVVAKPADLIYLAMYHPELFLSIGSWDLVLTGVNHGANVGLDVYHSGTVGMAMLAASGFGVPAVAFSQQMEQTTPDGSAEEANRFIDTDKFILNILAGLNPTAGDCYNVNFPTGVPKGWRTCQVAPFSHWRRPREEHPIVAQSGVAPTMIDHFELLAGNITISELALRVNPTVRY